MTSSIFSPATDGVLAALLAPFFMSLGFFVWDRRWTSSGASAFALNMYKCNVASIGFVAMCAARGFAIETTPGAVESVFTVTTVGYLILSSALGILVGDVLWLEALRLLGAKHVIVIDSLKPFMAAILGRVGLGEVLRAPAWGGMALTVLGVLVVGWEEQRAVPREEDGGDEGKDVAETEATDRDGFDIDGEDAARLELGGEGASNEQSSSETAKNHDAETERKHYRRGYFCAIFNLLADSLGSLLTKKFGAGMTTWSINLIRFGFAGVVTICISIGMRLRRRGSRVEEGQRDPKSGTECSNASLQADATNDAAARKDPILPQWFELPTLTRVGWLQITAGVGLVTFLCPALSHYALFQIALGLAVSLGSTGPLYGLLLDWPFKGKRPTAYGCAGVLLAIAGVVILCVWGTQ